MKKIQSSQAGVAHVLPLLLVVVLAVAGVGYYVWSQQKDDDKAKNNQSSQTANTQPQQTAEEKRIADAKAKLKLTATPLTTEGAGEIYYPEGWKVEQDAELGILAAFTNPTADKDANGNEYSATMVLSVEEVDAAATTADYVKALKTANAAGSENNKLVKERTLKTSDGTTLNVLESTYKEGSLQLYELQAVAVESGVALVFSATALEKDWPIYKDIVDQVIVK